MADLPEYHPDEYWENRGGQAYKAYTEAPAYAQYRAAQEDFFCALLDRLAPQRLLDFGCGSGKSFPLWIDIPEVHAYDRARSQIEVARATAAQLETRKPYRLMHCLTGHRTEVPYDDDYFDLVTVVEVLLHVLPDEIDALAGELHRICRGHVAIVTAAPFDNPAAHNFDHDYDRLLAGRFDIIDDFVVLQQRYIVARKVPAPAHATSARPAAALATN